MKSGSLKTFIHFILPISFHGAISKHVQLSIERLLVKARGGRDKNRFSSLKKSNLR